MVSIWVVSSVGGGILLLLAVLCIVALVREERARRLRIRAGAPIAPTTAPLHGLPATDGKGRWGLRIALPVVDQTAYKDQATGEVMRYLLRKVVEE